MPYSQQIRRQNIRIGFAFALVIAASVIGAVLAGKQAGKAGADAGRAEVTRQAKQYAYNFNVQQTRTLRKGCKRTNDFRMESNKRVTEHLKQDEAIKIIAIGARHARLTSFAKTHLPEDQKAASDYLRSIKLLDSITFKMLPLIDCAKQYPYPANPVSSGS